MQPRFMVGILVLQAEGLVIAIRYLDFLFQTAPAGVAAGNRVVIETVDFSPFSLLRTVRRRALS